MAQSLSVSVLEFLISSYSFRKEKAKQNSQDTTDINITRLRSSAKMQTLMDLGF